MYVFLKSLDDSPAITATCIIDALRPDSVRVNRGRYVEVQILKLDEGLYVAVLHCIGGEHLRELPN